MFRVYCTDGYIGETVRINIGTYADGAYSYNLEYAFGDTNGTIATDVYQNDTLTWTIPEDFYYQLPNSKSGPAQILFDVYDSKGALVHSGYADFTIMVRDNTTTRPTFTVSFAEADPKVAAITTSGIKYVSDTEYSINNAKGYKGATIVSYRAQNGEQVLTSSKGIFYDVTSTNYHFIVTDSRGISNSIIYTRNLNDYIRLTCNMWLEEVDAQSNTITLGLDGNYHNGDFYAVNSNNSLTLRVDLVDKDNQTITKTVVPTISGNKYTATVTFDGIDYRMVYEATGFADDRISSVKSKTVLCVGKPVFDWSNEDFRFNVPISSIDGYNFADFVIEYGEEAMGSNGTWYWRKWKSGRAECYGSRNFGRVSVEEQFASGASYMGYHSYPFNQPLPKGLFIDTPETIDIRLKYGGTATTPSTIGGYITIMGESEGENYNGYSLVVPSKDNTGSFVIAHPHGTFNTFGNIMPASHIGFNVIGRWK
jgi:hypothetical protein